MRKWMLLCSLIFALLGVSACASPDPNEGKQSYSISFDAMMGDRPFRCGTDYKNVGKSKATISLLAFRFYVHDVQLIRKDGTKVPLELTVDNKWQRDGIALLDFVDDKGNCKTGSSETNMKVVGLAPKHEDYTGVAFKVGMPASKNTSIDAAIAPPPFNESGMWWTWKGGYKFIRLDVKTDKHRSWFFHMGSSGCSGTVGGDYKCNKGNLTSVELTNFNPTTNKVVFNVAALYAKVDLNAPIDFTKDENKDGEPDDTLPGCMFERDPECGQLFQNLGISWGKLDESKQSVFVVK